MSPKLKNYITTIILHLMGVSVFAQNTPPPPDSRVPLPGLVVPLDENLLILLIAGILVGIYYFRIIKKVKINNQQ